MWSAVEGGDIISVCWMLCRGVAAVAELVDLSADRQAREINKDMYVYAISSLSTDYIYVGLTNDFDKRFYRHNKGWEKTTRSYRPFCVVFLTSVEDRKIGRLLEIYMKSGIGRQFIKNIV